MFAQARGGDPCPTCGKPLDLARGIEVGHIFKLGTKYSAALKCEFTDEKGENHPAVMGTYGIGVGRTMAAAVEQHHDADGIVWPLALAPFEIELVSLNSADAANREAADALYEALDGRGLEVLYDDRDERPGVKFKDADLLGFPIRVNVGGRASRKETSRSSRGATRSPCAPVPRRPAAARRRVRRGRAGELARRSVMRKLTREEALEYHSRGRKGKIEVVPTKPCRTQDDLSLAYTPGVAEPCLEIAKDPEKVYDYTAKGNLVAVITNGTAVLGLGNIGPLAGKPVMEGKGVLFKRFADIDVFDIEVDAQDPTTFIETVARDRADLRRHQPGGHQGARVLRDRGGAEEAPPDPGLPRRPARHRDHLRGGAAERPRDRRQEDRRGQGRLRRRRRLGDRLREALPLLGVKKENMRMVDKPA